MNATHYTTKEKIHSEAIITQLVGLVDSFDDDGETITCYNCSKFNEANVQISMESGTLTVLDSEGNPEDTFFIKCELIAVELVNV